MKLVIDHRYVRALSLYRHYKGGLYYVIGLARHTETDEEVVVYRATYGDSELFVRPSEMFLSEVEEGKENPTGQRYRFELINGHKSTY